MYLLDTNMLIYFFKDMGNVAKNLLAHSPQSISISAVTLYELQVGIAKSTHPKKRRKQLTELISRITVLPFGIPEALTAASIRATLEKQGTPIGPYDTLIAATALGNNATLVTRNLKEFRRVKGITLENWF